MYEKSVPSAAYMKCKQQGSGSESVVELVCKASHDRGQHGVPVDSSFLCIAYVAKEILLQVLSRIPNRNNCLKKEGPLAVQPTFS